jgi:hypothetical protein
LVRPLLMIMLDKRSHCSPEVRFAERDDSLQALGLADPTNRSANAFKFGLRQAGPVASRAVHTSAENSGVERVSVG